MKMTIHSTGKIVQLDGPDGAMPARVWEGTTERGIPVTAFITRVAVPEHVSDDEHERFRADLEEHAPPSAEAQAWPARMLLN